MIGGLRLADEDPNTAQTLRMSFRWVAVSSMSGLCAGIKRRMLFVVLCDRAAAVQDQERVVGFFCLAQGSRMSMCPCVRAAAAQHPANCFRAPRSGQGLREPQACLRARVPGRRRRRTWNLWQGFQISTGLRVSQACLRARVPGRRRRRTWTRTRCPWACPVTCPPAPTPAASSSCRRGPGFGKRVTGVFFFAGLRKNERASKASYSL